MKKLLVLDMDGTLIEYSPKNSSWERIASILGGQELKEKQKEKYKKWLSGEYTSYKEWCVDTYNLHKNYGISKEHMDKLIEEKQYRKGVKSLINEAQNRNYQTVIITGGIKNLADHVKKELNMSNCYTSCEYIFKENGELKDFNFYPYGTSKQKTEALKFLKAIYRYNREDIIYVGNGTNDYGPVKYAGTGISVSRRDCLDEVSDYHFSNLENIKKLL